jgi:hypothetical protein
MHVFVAFTVTFTTTVNIRVIKWRRMRWEGHVTRMGRAVYRVLVGRPKGWGPLGRPRRRWEDNIKMDLQKVDEGHGLI